MKYVKGKQFFIDSLDISVLSASYANTASYLNGILPNATTASYALTASYLIGGIASASFATNAGTAQTASYVRNAITASYVLNAITASYILNAVSASLSDSSSYSMFANSASEAGTSVTSAYAETASYSTGLTINGSEIIGKSQTNYNNIVSSIIGNNNIFNQVTGSFTSAFFKYTLSSGSNSRISEVLAVWNLNTMSFTDFSTVDIGTTTACTSSAIISSGNIQFNIQTNTSGWIIKSLVTYI